MATPQQKPTPFTTPDYTDGGCSCFRRFCFDDGSSNNYLLQERHEETWLASTLKKLKQFSEVVAGPKCSWNNFIRKCGKIWHPKRSYDKQTAAAQFQYSPESYALNFAGGEEDEVLLHSFSTRFAKAGL